MKLAAVCSSEEAMFDINVFMAVNLAYLPFLQMEPVNSFEIPVSFY
jgi:hypothetical protein